MPKSRRPRLSWFRFYADDFLGGTGALTAPECGRYLLLLLHQWGTKERQLLPSDPERLRVICRGEDPGPLVLSKFTEIDGGLRNERLAAEWEAARREYDHKAEGGGVKIPGRSPGQIPPQIAGRIGPPTKNQEPRTKNEQTEGVSLPPVSPERQADLDEIKACEATCREYMTLTGKALDEVLWEFSEVKGHRLVRLDTAPAKWLRVTHDRVRSALIEARQEKRKPAGEDPLVKIRRIEASRAARLKGETA